MEKESKWKNLLKSASKKVYNFIEIFIFIVGVTCLIFALLSLHLSLQDKSDKSDEYLLGDIVVLKDKDKKVMITGYYQVESGTDRVYEYVGVRYPDGYLGAEYNYLFDSEDINYKIDKNTKDNLEKEAIKRKNEIKSWSTFNENPPTTQPETTQSETTQSETTQPETTQSETTQSETTQS